MQQQCKVLTNPLLHKYAASFSIAVPWNKSYGLPHSHRAYDVPQYKQWLRIGN